MAAATAAGGDVLEQTRKGIKLLEPILIASFCGTTPPQAPIRKTGRKSPEFATPTRMAAAAAARIAAEALEKAQEADQAARHEEMASSVEEAASAKRKAEAFMPPPDPPKTEVQHVRFKDQDDAAGSIDDIEDLEAAEEEFAALPPSITDSNQTSLHSFMLQTPGTVSVAGKSRGWARRAQLREVKGGPAKSRREDRSRSPLHEESSSSGNENYYKGVGDITPPSELDAIIPKSGFAAASSPAATA